MNSSYSLFLLMFNLSLLHNRDRIIELFIEGIREIFSGVNIGYSEADPGGGDSLFEIRTRQSSFGFIQVSGTGELQQTDLTLISSASQMLAIFLENLKLGDSLRQENIHLENLAQQKLEELGQTVKDLEDSRAASINIIEDMALEIEKRKKAEKRIRESEQKYRHLFENMSHGVYYRMADGTRTDINPAGLSILGVSMDQFTGNANHQHKWEIIDEEQREVREEEFPSAVALNEGKETSRVLGIYNPEVKDYRWVSLSARPEFRTGDDKAFRALVIMTDITESKRLEAEKFKLLDIIDNSLNEIYLFRTENLKFEYANKGAQKNIGYEPDELLNLTLPDISTGLTSESFREMIRPLENGSSKFIVFETIISRKDGTQYPAEGHLQLHKASNTNLIFAIINNITERKNASEAIKKLNEELEERVKRRTWQLEAANKELEAFSYSVSHDLRAPLRAIHSFTSILRQDYEKDLDEEGKRICGIIESSSVKMGTLIDDLLAFARIGRSSMNYSRIIMNDLVKNVYEEITTPEERSRIRFQADPLPDISGDASLMKHVLLNLLSNAIKYSSKRNPSVIKVGSERNNYYITYFVKDNGVGFDMDYREKLFRVFQRLHSAKDFEGNGVGLAIVQRVIERHGGKVWAESKVDEGATFYYSLPA